MYWLTGILGFVMIVAPYVFGYNINAIALWTSVILGAGVLLVSFFEGVVRGKEQWEYWVAAVIGVAAIFAPFVLGFNTHFVAMWTSIVAGTMIAITAGYKLLNWQ